MNTSSALTVRTIMFAILLLLFFCFSAFSQQSFEPGLSGQHSDQFKIGSSKNVIVITIRNDTNLTIPDYDIVPVLPLHYVEMTTLEPRRFSLEPGATQEIVFEFSIRDEAPDGESEIVSLFVTEPRSIKVGRFDLEIGFVKTEEDEAGTAECNSAVEQGGDAGGGVTVDLGGFVGKAGFSWGMLRIKDRMDVTVGTVTKSTGCVSGTGTFELDIPAGAGTASVTVFPNCDGNTSGTRWSFEFECPLRSAVTADGSGSQLPSGQGTAGSGSQGAPVLPGPAVLAPGLPGSPTPLLPSGSTAGTTGALPSAGSTGEQEPNDSAAVATPVPPSGTIDAVFDKTGDVDFFSIEVGRHGELQVLNPGRASLQVGVHPAQGGNWIKDESARSDGKWVFDLPAPGRFVVRATRTDKSAAAMPYSLETVFRPSPDRGEPNPAAATAAATPASGSLVGTILPRGDADFYQVDVARQGEWTIADRARPDGMKLQFGVHHSGGGNWLADRSPKGDGKLVVDLPEPGRYVLRVIDGAGGRSVDPYLLDLAYAETGDMHEPNQSAATAASVGPDETLTGAILPAGDADFFKVRFPRHGEWTIERQAQPAGMSLAFGVHPAAGGNWLSDRSPKDDGKLVVDIPEPGEYVLRITDTKGGRSAGQYRVGLSWKPSDDGFEPNGSAAQARSIGPDARVTATILPSGDADYYAIDVPTHGEWSIETIRAPAGIQMAYGVHAASGGNWFTDRSPKGDGRLVVDLPGPGRYVLRATDAKAGRNADAYSFAARYTPSPDRREPNNSAASASPVSPDGEISGTILPKGDADFYVANLTRAGRWTIAIAGQPQGMAVNLGVHRASGGNWLPDKSPGGDGTLAVDIAEPGRYVLRVTDGKGGRSVAPYRLTLGYR